MRWATALVVVAVVLAGCGAKASRDDLFGYMKKPLFASGFPLEDARAAPQSQQFFVEDGSMAGVIIYVWVNATAGSATVQVYNAHGDEVVHTTQTTSASLPLDLGAWKIVVSGTPDAAGRVDLLVTRR